MAHRFLSSEQRTLVKRALVSQRRSRRPASKYAAGSGNLSGNKIHVRYHIAISEKPGVRKLAPPLSVGDIRKRILPATPANNAHHIAYLKGRYFMLRCLRCCVRYSFFLKAYVTHKSSCENKIIKQIIYFPDAWMRLSSYKNEFLKPITIEIEHPF